MMRTSIAWDRSAPRWRSTPSAPESAANTDGGSKKTAFGSVDKVDLWTGGLAERHAKGALLGQTFTVIIADQFERLRDGDRYYFEHALNPADVRMVKNTSLSDIITRNTDATDMQADVFMNVPRGPENDLTI